MLDKTKSFYKLIFQDQLDRYHENKDKSYEFEGISCFGNEFDLHKDNKMLFFVEGLEYDELDKRKLKIKSFLYPLELENFINIYNFDQFSCTDQDIIPIFEKTIKERKLLNGNL